MSTGTEPKQVDMEEGLTLPVDDRETQQPSSSAPVIKIILVAGVTLFLGIGFISMSKNMKTPAIEGAMKTANQVPKPEQKPQEVAPKKSQETAHKSKPEEMAHEKPEEKEKTTNIVNAYKRISKNFFPRAKSFFKKNVKVILAVVVVALAVASYSVYSPDVHGEFINNNIVNIKHFVEEPPQTDWWKYGIIAAGTSFSVSSLIIILLFISENSNVVEFATAFMNLIKAIFNTTKDDVLNWILNPRETPSKIYDAFTSDTAAALRKPWSSIYYLTLKNSDFSSRFFATLTLLLFFSSLIFLVFIVPFDFFMGILLSWILFILSSFWILPSIVIVLVLILLYIAFSPPAATYTRVVSFFGSKIKKVSEVYSEFFYGAIVAVVVTFVFLFLSSFWFFANFIFFSAVFIIVIMARVNNLTDFFKDSGNNHYIELMIFSLIMIIFMPFFTHSPYNSLCICVGTMLYSFCFLNIYKRQNFKEILKLQ